MLSGVVCNPVFPCQMVISQLNLSIYCVLWILNSIEAGRVVRRRPLFRFYLLNLLRVYSRCVFRFDLMVMLIMWHRWLFADNLYPCILILLVSFFMFVFSWLSSVDLWSSPCQTSLTLRRSSPKFSSSSAPAMESTSDMQQTLVSLTIRLKIILYQSHMGKLGFNVQTCSQNCEYVTVTGKSSIVKQDALQAMMYNES